MLDAQFQKIIEQLADHEKRIRVLEGGKVKNSVEKNPTDSGKKRSRAKGIDLNSPIMGLYNDGFFDDLKTDNDVIKKLRAQVLTPRRASVSNVLRRLASPKKGLLERQGDGTKKNPWKYRKKR